MSYKNNAQKIPMNIQKNRKQPTFQLIMTQTMPQKPHINHNSGLINYQVNLNLKASKPAVMHTLFTKQIYQQIHV